MSKNGKKRVRRQRPGYVRPAPPVVEFSADPHVIELGGQSTLAWNAKRVKLLTLDDAELDGFDGQMQVRPAKTTEYTLVATFNNNWTRDYIVLVTVNPPPAAPPPPPAPPDADHPV